MADDEHSLWPEERSFSSLTPFADLAGDRQVHLLGCVEMPTFEQALTYVANAAGAFPGDVFGVIQALISRGLADREEHGRVERPSLAGDRLRPVLAEHGLLREVVERAETFRNCRLSWRWLSLRLGCGVRGQNYGFAGSETKSHV